MVVEAETTILFQIVLYLNLIYLIQQQIKWFHGFLLVDKQWGSDYSDSNGEKLIIFPISFKKFVKAVSTNVNSNTSIAPANLSSVNINNFKLHCKGNNEQYFINLCHWIAIGV